MAYVQPEITPFNCFNANDIFIIELIGGISSDKFSEYEFRAYGNQVKTQSKTQIINITKGVEDYINDNPNVVTQGNTVMVYYNYNYYLILPKNYCTNGFNWQIEITFFGNNALQCSVSSSFGCYSGSWHG